MGGLYVAREGAVYEAETGTLVRDAANNYQPDWYKAAGRKHDRTPSQMRPMRAAMIGAAEEASSWFDFHAMLAEINVAYDGEGNGARISFRGHSAKASEVHRALSRPKLEARLGPFEPDANRLNFAFEAYCTTFKANLDNLRRAREKERERLRSWVSATLSSLLASTHPDVAKAVKQEAKAAEEALAEAFKLAIARYTQHRLKEQEWKDGGEPVAPAPTISPALLLPANLDGTELAWTKTSHFERSESAFATEYRSSDGTPLFTDHRVMIVVQATDHTDGLDEALRIASERWGSVTARGSEAYLALVAARAAALGIKVRGADGAPLPMSARPAEVNATPNVKIRAVPAPTARKPAGADDPAHRQRIKEALALIGRFEGLALRRGEGPEDELKSGRSGMLEIVLGGDRFDAREQQLASHAIFDQDELIQKVLEEIRLAELVALRGLLSSADLDPNNLSPEAIQKCLPNKAEIRRPAYVAQGDYDFDEMLKEVRERLLERAHKRQSGAATSVAPPAPEHVSDKAFIGHTPACAHDEAVPQHIWNAHRNGSNESER